MITELKTGPLMDQNLLKVLKESIFQAEDSDFVESVSDECYLIYYVSWYRRYVVVDKITRSILYDANGYGFKSVDSAEYFIQAEDRRVSRMMYAYDPEMSESHYTGIDFCDLC